MRYHREDVVQRAIVVLDTYGLADLTMRRLGAELGVQPSALYHHFANKQSLLAAVADEILARGRRASSEQLPWDARVLAVCAELRDAMLAYRDGAEVVATVHAFGLGAQAPGRELEAALADGGLGPDLRRTAARTLLHYVFGHVSEEQTHLQASSAGAIDGPPASESDFELGLAIVMDGIRLRQRETAR
jgi:AcrR family transcriptional regulator